MSRSPKLLRSSPALAVQTSDSTAQDSDRSCLPLPSRGRASCSWGDRSPARQTGTQGANGARMHVRPAGGCSQTRAPTTPAPTLEPTCLLPSPCWHQQTQGLPTVVSVASLCDPPVSGWSTRTAAIAVLRGPAAASLSWVIVSSATGPQALQACQAGAAPAGGSSWTV